MSAWKWKEYIDMYAARFTPEITDSLCGAQCLRLFIGSFLDLYRNHRELLRFNHIFNSFLYYSQGTEEQRQPYRQAADSLGTEFHKLYERGAQDGTLNTDIPEQTMFSSTFHIMLAAVTRYAMGLAVVYEKDPENELVMLAEMLMSRFTKNADKDQGFGLYDKEDYYVR